MGEAWFYLLTPPLPSPPHTRRAVDENVALRSSLRQLDELYAAEVQEGGAGSRK
jgi:hypothetical protein